MCVFKKKCVALDKMTTAEAVLPPTLCNKWTNKRVKNILIIFFIHGTQSNQSRIKIVWLLCVKKINENDIALSFMTHVSRSTHSTVMS